MREKCDDVFQIPYPKDLLLPEDSQAPPSGTSISANQPFTTKQICYYAYIELLLQKLESTSIYKYPPNLKKAYDYPTHQLRKHLTSLSSSSSSSSPAFADAASIWSYPTFRTRLYSNFANRYGDIYINSLTISLTISNPIYWLHDTSQAIRQAMKHVDFVKLVSLLKNIYYRGSKQDHFASATDWWRQVRDSLRD